MLSKKSIPNTLSLLQTTMPFFIAAAISHSLYAPAFLILIAALITDWLDGLAARAFDAKSRFGEIIDPIADKALYGGTLGAIYWYAGVSPLLWVILFTLAPEGILTLLRCMNIRGAATVVGKIKMVRQSASMIILMLGLVFLNQSLLIFGIAVSATAVIFSWMSLLSQIIAFEKTA